MSYLLVVGVLTVPFSLPILRIDSTQDFADNFKFLRLPVKEFNGQNFNGSPFLSGRLGWDELVREVAETYDGLPAEDRAVAGIYADWYMPAGAIDQLGSQYNLPHAVSGSLTYYLWGPGYSWDVMIIITNKTNNMAVFFEECELKRTVQHEYNVPVSRLVIFVCRKPKVSPDVIWSSMKSYR
jgi:hypothetical protein